jgi:lysophospholipase L1-like esterase
MRLPLHLLFLLLMASAAVAQQKTNSFEKEILAFEASDKTNPPPKNAILFTGSSSIRLWKTLAQDLPEYRVLNRGFGGSQISDCLHFFNRLVPPYEPEVIVFYCGGNDLNAKKSPETVLNHFKQFVARTRVKLPKTQIAYISIAGNPARWAQVDKVREANRLIREWSATQPNLSFIDVFSPMMGPDGTPQPDIFVADKLHMNEKGYAIWKQVVGAHLKKIVPAGSPATQKR